MISGTEPYYSYRQFLKEKYGDYLYTVPIDLSFGCPNRDADGSGGCSFCHESGARAQQTINSATMEDQVRDAIAFAAKRYKAKKFMAYIQAFTGTFAAATEQEKTYGNLLQLFNFDAVHIGTRPDCLPEETLDVLTGLQKDSYDLRIELGIQTTNNDTLQRINRGHTWEQSEDAVRRLHERGIPVIAHVIIGLPGENTEDFLRTADSLAKLPLEGVKIHNLHVVKNTRLAEEYIKDPFPVLNEYEYLDVLIEFIRRTPANIPIIRIQTDTPEEDLIAPRWSLAKGQLIDMLSQHMKWRQVRQGDLVDINPHPPIENPDLKPVTTDDGSLTFWNPLFKEHYHTSVGAMSEAVNKYVKPARLTELISHKPVRILDVCFGLGYNSLAARSAVLGQQDAHSLDIIGLEIDRGIVNAAAQTIQDTDSRRILLSIYQKNRFEEQGLSIEVLWGDARHTINRLMNGEPFDIAFLDPFSTQKNCELWTVEFFSRIKKVLNGRGIILTYSSGMPVRAGLLEAGFHVGKTPSYGHLWGGTIAAINQDDIEIPLEQEELDILQNTKRGIPYHDPGGTSASRIILKTREDQIRRYSIGYMNR